MAISTMVTNSSSFPDNWNDLFQSDQPLDMDVFMQSDLYAARRNHEMKIAIANTISGSISLIASSLLIIHILRSYEYLSTTYHRLIFGLSAADIVSSFSFALSSTVAPKEMNYLVPFASGNVTTCSVLGSLSMYAVFVSVCYNCSVCFYYFAIITCNKKYDYIRRKLETWFHGISILLPLVMCVILLATNSYNGSGGGVCFPDPHNPPHCIGYKVGVIPKGYSIPCGRGGENDGYAELRANTLYGGFLFLLFVAPATILVTMVAMFRSVSNIEKQMQKYGVRALRSRTALAAQTTNTNSTDHQEATGFGLAFKIKELGKYLFCFTADASQMNHRFAICYFRCLFADDQEKLSLPSIKSNKMKTQKRAVLRMAFGYAGAWLLVWSPFFFQQIVSMIFKKSVSDTVKILTNFMIPMQGFCNFFVFMAPKTRNTRMMIMRRGRIQDQNLTWCQALHKAYMFRGNRGL